MTDYYFSKELKELVMQSREMAIDLGYDYISTIHFFLADCESKRADSILKYGFKDENEYLDFKKQCKLEKEEILDLLDASLPLTKEAETTFRIADTERLVNKHAKCYPFHFFIAALKNKDSLLFDSFKHDKDALEKLVKYYQYPGQLESSDKTQTSRPPGSFLKKIGKFFKLRN